MEKERLNALVIKARAGDKNAMSDLIQASYQDMYYYALKIVKKDDIAADATQDSCVEIIQTLGNLKESAAFVTWCRRIVYHQCTKRIGKSRMVALDENEDGETILDRIPDETPNSLPEEVVENRELRKIMLDMIDELPESQRSALMLYYYEKLSVKQIAEIQDENENTVKSRLFHGRKAVQKQVEDYEKKNGIRLHSVGVLPLLYFLFHAGRAEADAAAGALVPQAMAAVAPTIAAASGAATAAGTAAATGSAIASSLVVKIAAGVVAAALAVGGIVVATQPEDESEDDHHSNISTSESSVPQANPGHTHSEEDKTWAFDDEVHWQICSCGMVSDDRQIHTYADGECIVCRMPEPLPADKDLLTYDCTQLTGRWFNMSNGYKENPIDEFYISGDGSILIQGTTYYPIGSRGSVSDLNNGGVIEVFFQTTPYNPEIGMTEEEMLGSPISLLVSTTDGKFDCSLFAISTEVFGTRILGNFYRESDYFGYNKITLTSENFSDYYDITIQPVEFYYTNHNGCFDAIQKMTFTLKGDYGYPSWCNIECAVQVSYTDVAYHVETSTHEVTYISPVTLDDPLTVQFFGYHTSKTLLETRGTTIPSNNIIEWMGKVAYGYTITDVHGYIFVPKQ